MIVTFPHFGDAYIYARLLFRTLEIPHVIPPRNTVDGLNRGSQYSPDEICLPFKLFMENLMEAHKLGADTVIMPSSGGTCRLGEFCELLKLLLDQKGYVFHWIVFDTPNDIGLKELLRRFNNAFHSEKGKWFTVKTFREVYSIVKQLERLEARARGLSGYTENSREIKLLLKECKRELETAKDIPHANEILGSYRFSLNNLKLVPDRRPTKLILTGEIFTLVEPIAELYLEDLLFDRGVSFKKDITIGWWIRRTVLNPLSNLFAIKRPCEGMPYSIGGYSKDTVIAAMNSRYRGFDGVVQLLPSGCMPEIVAKSVLDESCHRKDIKKLTLIFDEISGIGGYETRLEAFLDMLEQRRERQHVFYGN